MITPQPFQNLKDIQISSRKRGGFKSQGNRILLWPKILGVNPDETINYKGYINSHRDEFQVQCDIERSLWHFSHVSSWQHNFLKKRRNEVSDIVLAILCRNPSLFYFQGFHDFISVFVMLLDDDHLAFATAEVACNHFISDFMTVDFEIISKLMTLILRLVGSTDEILDEFLKKASIEPFFATSWFLTWFAHDICDIDVLACIFDALLCSPPIYILYLCTAVRSIITNIIFSYFINILF